MCSPPKQPSHPEKYLHYSGPWAPPSCIFQGHGPSKLHYSGPWTQSEEGTKEEQKEVLALFRAIGSAICMIPGHGLHDSGPSALSKAMVALFRARACRSWTLKPTSSVMTVLSFAFFKEKIRFHNKTSAGPRPTLHFQGTKIRFHNNKKCVSHQQLCGFLKKKYAFKKSAGPQVKKGALRSFCT